MQLPEHWLLSELPARAVHSATGKRAVSARRVQSTVLAQITLSSIRTGCRQVRDITVVFLVLFLRFVKENIPIFLSCTGDIRVVTCHRTTLPDRTCTTDTPAVSRVPLAIPRVRLLPHEATAIRRGHRLTRPLWCNSRRRPASLLRPRNRQPYHRTHVRKITIDRNK